MIVFEILNFIIVMINSLSVAARTLRIFRSYSWRAHAALGLSFLHLVLSLSPSVRLRWVALVLLIAVIYLSSSGGGRWLKKLRERASSMLTEVQAGAISRDTAVARS